VPRYERRLEDEWGHYTEFANEALAERTKEPCEAELQQTGRAVYNWMEQKANIPIRRDCTEPYVMRGSYHILANYDPPKVGWHPLFEERLSSNGASSPRKEAS
jgi:hypothetical protein